MKTRQMVQILTMLGLASFFNLAAAEAGRVLVAVGDVSVVRAAKEIPLTAGANIESGDTLRTGATSNAQVRMTDGSIVALRPQTEFRLDDYRFAGKADGSEKGFFSLVKGGFRTITGVIGKLNRDNYKVTTQTAAIGIRGTDYTLVQCAGDCTNTDGSKAKDGLYGSVTDGRINAANEGGGKDFARGEAFFVADAHTAPQGIVAPPGFLSDKLAGRSRNQNRASQESAKTQEKALTADARPAAAEAAAVPAPVVQTSTTAPVTTFVATEAVNASGTSAALSNFTINPIALVVAYAPSGSSMSLGDVDSGNADNNATITVSGGNLLYYAINGGPWTGQAGSSTTNQGTMSVDGSTVYWGRWQDGSVNNTSGYHGPLSGASLQSGVHYMFGDANTSDAVIAAKSGSVTYSFVGGTLATNNNGAVGTTMSGSLGVNFTAHTVTPNITYSVGGSSYNITGFAMPIGGTGFSSGVSGANNTGTCAGGGCSTGVPIDYVVMHGNFVGKTGAGAITSVTTYSNANSQSTAVSGLFKAP